MSKILLAEDDITLARQIKEWFEAKSYTVEVVYDGISALELLKTSHFDVIILDWGLPELSGIEICNKYRATGGNTPMLMLTGRNQITDKETGFDAGVDDYLTKPFNMRELTARITALLRRPPVISGDKLCVGKLTLETKSRSVTLDGNDIVLQPKEFAILEYLMRNSDRVVGTQELLSAVWKSDAAVGSDSLYTYIKMLRKKLMISETESVIKTVNRVGYTLSS